MKNKFLIGTLLVLNSVLFTETAQAQNAAKNQIGYSEIGMASYYPSDEDKRKTLSGDVYDMTAMETAHKNFPMGSLIKVTNLENGKEVILRVNDKPNTTERIMDMTLAAADSLGMVKDDKAVIPVKTEIMALGVPRSNNLRQVLATAPSPTKEVKETKVVKEEKTAKESEKELAKKIAADKLALKVSKKAEEKAKAETVKKIAKEKAKEKADKAQKDKIALTKAKKEKAEKEKADKAKIEKEKAEKLAKNPVKIVAAAPKEATKTDVKTDAKVVVDDKVSATFKDIAVYDVNGKKQKPQGFGIQTGYFVEANRAVAEVKTLEAMKIGKVYIQTIETDGKKKYAVLVGEFKTKDETKELTKQLVEKKYSPFVKKH
jgi:rare lipoprotein A